MAWTSSCEALDEVSWIVQGMACWIMHRLLKLRLRKSDFFVLSPKSYFGLALFIYFLGLCKDLFIWCFKF